MPTQFEHALPTISEDRSTHDNLTSIGTSEHSGISFDLTRAGSIQSRRSMLRALFSYPVSSSKPPRNTAWLDGLRGVAALEVVLHHYHLHFLGINYNYAFGSKPDMYQWWRLPFIRNYWHSAHAMVNVFFVISGFVLTQRSLSFIQTKQHDKLFTSLSSAVFRRLLRIYLPVIPVTFVGMLLVRWGLRPSGVGLLPIPYRDTIFGQIADWYGATEKFLNPFHDYNNNWDYVHPYEHVMWTLPLEYYGSIVCYVTVLGISRVTNRWKRTFIIASIIYLAMKRTNWWSANFLAGTLLGDFLLYQESEGEESTTKSHSQSSTMITKTCWAVLFLWSFFLCGLPDPHPSEYGLPGYDLYIALTPTSFRSLEGGGRFWWMVAGIGLTVSISQSVQLKRLLESTFCQYLGKVSFMLYLIHSYIYEIIGDPWMNALNATFGTVQYDDKLRPISHTASSPAQWLIYILFWALMFPVLAACSGLVTRLVDEESIKLTKRVEDLFTKEEQ